MIKCQVCQTENLDSSQYCDECGSVLMKHGENNATQTQVESQNIETKANDSHVLQYSNVTSLGIPPIVEDNMPEELAEVEENTNHNKTGHSLLVIERGEAVGKEFILCAEESNIGRWDADNGIFPDVDLDAFDAEAKVSRRHARIIYQNKRFMIEDLGSTNGTFINRGRRLIPGTPHILNDGDEVIVGKTFLRFNINE